MTGRERVKIALSHKEADRVPRFDQFWKETFEVYGMTQEQLEERFDYDMHLLHLDNSMRFPAHKRVDGDWEEFDDRCGYTLRRRIGVSSAHYVSHVNTDADVWRDMRDRFCLDKAGESRICADTFHLRTQQAPSWEQAVADANKVAADKYKTLQFYGPYEGTWRHHGMVETLTDLCSEPEYMDDMFSRITDLTLEVLDYSI